MTALLHATRNLNQHELDALAAERAHVLALAELERATGETLLHCNAATP